LAKSKFKLVSNFPEAKRAAREITQLAVAQAVLDGENTANDRLAKADVEQGYDLPVDVQKEVGHMDGKITYDHWWGRFFEYGTVYIPATSFMRPGHRRMRKTFTAIMGTQFEGWIRKRAGVRR